MQRQASVSLDRVPNLSLPDFHDRWRKARLSILANVVSPLEGSSEASELEALARVPQSDHSALLLGIFRVSQRFAMSASRHFGIRCELPDFVALLSSSAIPCVTSSQASWTAKGSAYVLNRKGCSTEGGARALYCDYWREAIDGLVMGLGESERFARHSSMGHGDPECTDIIYDEACASENRFGSIPDRLAADLASISVEFERHGVQVSFAGVSEGVLYFQMLMQGKAPCGAGGRLLQENLARKVAKALPGIALQDISPLAVYGEKA